MNPYLKASIAIVLCGTLAFGAWRWMRSWDPGEAATAPAGPGIVERLEEGDGLPPAAAAARSAALPSPSLESLEKRLGSIAHGTRLLEAYEPQGGSRPAKSRWLLLEGSPSGKRLLVEERWKSDASGEWLALKPTVFEADALLLDLDPRRIDVQALEAFLAARGLVTMKESKLTSYRKVGRQTSGIAEFLGLEAELAARFPGAFVEKEILHSVSALPSEWRRARFWHLERVQAPAAWDASTGSPEVVIAVLDTGMDRSHVDLSDNLFVNPGETPGNGIDDDGNGFVDDVSGWDFLTGQSFVSDDSGHGTHVAGIAGAVGDNNTGALGVNWRVKLLPLDVGTSDSLATSDIVEALAYVAALKRQGVNVVVTNNSYGSSSPSIGIQRQIQNHRELGILFVAAAGNDGINVDGGFGADYPAALPEANIISVANSSQGDELSFTSNYGSTSVDLAAPGSEILSTYPGSSYQFLSGTSMASPMVAGAVALLKSREPELSWSEAKSRILDTADRTPTLTGLVLTGGRLNLFRCLMPQHTIGIRGHPEKWILVDRPGTPVRLELEGAPEAALSVEVEESQSQAAATVFDLGAGVFEVELAAEGVYVLRAVSILDGVRIADEKTLVVGQAEDVRSGLANHWKMEGSGSTLIDSAGRANASVQGASRETGEFGPGLRFRGGTDQASFNARFADRVTITAFVKLSDLQSSPHPRFVNTPFYYLYASSGEGPLVPDGNRQTFKFFSDRSGDIGVWNTPPLTARENEWVYVAATYDSRNVQNVPSIFLDGRAQHVWTQNQPSGSQATAGSIGYLGNNNESGADARPFDGSMKEVRIYDRELSDWEIDRIGAGIARYPWRAAAIRMSGTALVGERVVFTLEGLEGERRDSVEWRVSAAEGYEILSDSPQGLELRFLSDAPCAVVARVRDGLSSQYLSLQVEPAPSVAYWEGTTESGAWVWVERDFVAGSAWISLIDPLSGFYRMRQPLAVDANGNFATGGEGIGRIAGVLSDRLTGEVSGYGILFSGEQTVLDAEASSRFEGVYRGGILGVNGAMLDVRVRRDGSAYLWFNGEDAQLARGAVSDSGELALASHSGRALAARFDASGRFASGELGEASFYFEAADGPSAPPFASLFVESEARAARQAVLARFWDATGNALPRGGGFEAIASRLRLHGPSSEGASAAFGVSASGKTLASTGGLKIGFSLEGSQPSEIMAWTGRARSGALPLATAGLNPRLILSRVGAGGETALIAANDNWDEGKRFVGEQGEQGAFLQIIDGFALIGQDLFPLGARDAALRIWLEPGAYELELAFPEGEDGDGTVSLQAVD